MISRKNRTWVFILCIAMSASMAFAGSKVKNKDKNKDPHRSGMHESKSGTRVAVNIFAGHDHDIIRSHFATNRGSLPPGLAKRGGDLPPGLEKQLRRNGHLPPGLEKKLHPFPIELERRLPPLRAGLVRGMIGASAVIMDGRTSVILDVFKVF